jgi:hypothetical protein
VVVLQRSPVKFWVDRNHSCLSRVEPERPATSKVLREDCNHPLDRPKDGAVDHNWTLHIALAWNVLQLKSLWKLEIKLDRRALERPLESVPNLNVDLQSAVG